VRHPVRLAAIAAAAFAASACSHMPDVGSAIGNVRGVAATPDLTPRERVRLAIELLDEGDERRAEVELEVALRDDPNSSAARRLLEQISGDPQALLRGEARSYTVRRGETMAVLAERFQGDALLFYALARFNDIEAPNQVGEGQVLMIPRRPGLRSASVEMPPPPAPSASASASAPASVPRGPNAARADQLRLQALQHLNGGQVDRAVALLRQAQALDAANSAIQRDLDRAERLQASLRTNGGASRQ
jgi:hypothetical protein